MGGIVVVTCEACGCDSAKIADSKPSPCQFCGVTRPPWWELARDHGPRGRKPRKAAQAREARA